MTRFSSSSALKLEDMSEDELVQLLNSEGRMIPDVRDPSRPYFTVDELRKVLSERNELKSKILDVEEELSVYAKAG